MKPSEIDWTAFENAVLEVINQCLEHLDENPPADPVYVLGLEGLVEQGVISVGANTTAARVPDAEWWMPDWCLPYLDERLSTDPVTTVLQPFAESISEIEFETDSQETYHELLRLFRLSCLRALRRSESNITNHSFPRSPDFSVMYMDDDEGFFQGADGINDGIESLARH